MNGQSTSLVLRTHPTFYCMQSNMGEPGNEAIDDLHFPEKKGLECATGIREFFSYDYQFHSLSILDDRR